MVAVDRVVLEKVFFRNERAVRIPFSFCVIGLRRERRFQFIIKHLRFLFLGAVVVVQLVERSLPSPEICGSNLVIANFIYYQLH